MYPDCRTPIHVMPNPVGLDLFDRAWIAERRLRGRSARRECLFIGGDFPRKGGYDLLEAWTRGEFAARADLDCWSPGGPLPSPLPAGVRVLQPASSAHTPEWTAAWHDADLFVMPTRNEAFGLVYQEAAAAGLPAIGSRLNAVPEIITDGETGLLVTPGHVAELVAALDRLIASAELRERLGRAARDEGRTGCRPGSQHREQLLALITQASRHG